MLIKPARFFKPYSVFHKLMAVALLVPTTAMAISFSGPDNTLQRIKDAYAQGDVQTFNELTSQLPKNSPFKPYAEVWAFRLSQRGKTPTLSDDPDDDPTVWSAGAVIPVLQASDNSWPAEQLRRQWLGQLARAGKWERYQQQRALLRYKPDQDVQCADMLLSADQGEVVKSDVMVVLNTDQRLPKTCRVMLKSFYERKIVSADLLDLRILNLVANNQLTNALAFVDELQDTHWGKYIDKDLLHTAIFKPEQFLKNQKKYSAENDLYLASALARQTRSDPDGVAEGLQLQFGKQLSDTNKAWLWAEIGYRAALQWDKRAEDYYSFSNPKVMNLEQQEWKVRAALFNEDWSALIQAVKELPADHQNDAVWLYWTGRALASKGQLDQARMNWIRIARPFTFYGKLAEEELGQTIGTAPKPKFVTAEELKEAKNNAGLQRALALYNAGFRTEGFWEFNLQTAQMNDRQLLAAATWANNNELYDRAIAAADKTQDEHDLYLRYLTPYKDNMEAQTKAIGIDASWVYGLIRQESRFVTIARSGVGASGLMQIMPATAKYVAKKIGFGQFSKADLNDIDSNLLLGTSYLKMVYEKLDNSPVLASAGYNAGPGRPASWKKRLGNRAMEGAMFAELIPFDETREYVKNVMSNTVAYSLLLNNSSISLKERLGIIRNTD